MPAARSLQQRRQAERNCSRIKCNANGRPLARASASTTNKLSYRLHARTKRAFKFARAASSAEELSSERASARLCCWRLLLCNGYSKRIWCLLHVFGAGRVDFSCNCATKVNSAARQLTNGPNARRNRIQISSSLFAAFSNERTCAADNNDKRAKFRVQDTLVPSLSQLGRSSHLRAPTERANGNKRIGPLSRWGQLPAPNALAGGRSFRRRADPLPLDLNLDLSQCQRRRRRISRCRSSDSFARLVQRKARPEPTEAKSTSRVVKCSLAGATKTTTTTTTKAATITAAKSAHRLELNAARTHSLRSSNSPD